MNVWIGSNAFLQLPGSRTWLSVYTNVPFYRTKLDEAGVAPNDINTR